MVFVFLVGRACLEGEQSPTSAKNFTVLVRTRFTFLVLESSFLVWFPSFRIFLEFPVSLSRHRSGLVSLDTGAELRLPFCAIFWVSSTFCFCQQPLDCAPMFGGFSISVFFPDLIFVESSLSEWKICPLPQFFMWMLPGLDLGLGFFRELRFSIFRVPDFFLVNLGSGGLQQSPRYPGDLPVSQQFWFFREKFIFFETSGSARF